MRSIHFPNGKKKSTILRSLTLWAGDIFPRQTQSLKEELLTASCNEGNLTRPLFVAAACGHCRFVYSFFLTACLFRFPSPSIEISAAASMV